MGCAVHRAAMLFIMASLPALGLRVLAHEVFSQVDGTTVFHHSNRRVRPSMT